MAEQHPDEHAALRHAQEVGHEVRDANVVGIVLSGLGLLAVLVGALVTSFWLGAGLTSDEPSERPSGPRPAGELPIFRDEIQANQHVIRQRQEALADEVLSGYGWVDRSQGLARIPIKRAMELLAEQDGFDVQAPQPSADLSETSSSAQDSGANFTLPSSEPEASPSGGATR